jgi:uncharacterized protein
MALLIDGYNLLYVTGIFAQPGAGTELHRTRLALLRFIASAIDQRERRQTTIVFDAAGAPPGLPRTTTHEDMTVHFARRHSDADELIEELLEEYPAPRTLLVVSSDHRIQRAARRHGATFIDSEKWYAQLLANRRQRGMIPDNVSPKPDQPVSPEELAHWLREFNGEFGAIDEPESPFPPGYGDDVAEGE